MLVVVRIVTYEQHLTVSEMSSLAYAGPVIYIRTIIDGCDIVVEIYQNLASGERAKI